MKSFKKFFTYCFVLIIIFIGASFLFSFSVLAEGGGTTGSGISLESPINATSFTTLADNIIDFLIKIGAPIAVIVVIYAGFLFMTSGGNEEKVTKAKSALTWAVVGLAVLIVAKSVTTILNELLTTTSS